MTKYQHAMPQHIGVHEKFCLLREGAVQDGSQSSDSYPYQQAVQELCKLKAYTCPLQKLECLGKPHKKLRNQVLKKNSRLYFSRLQVYDHSFLKWILQTFVQDLVFVSSFCKITFSLQRLF